MTCKDCLHYEACDRLADAKLGYGIMQVRTGVCMCFSDKSEWFHLSCKVGDVVYCFEPCFDTDHHPKLKVVEKEIIELKTIATVFGLNFDINNIGKTVFLTREEAEKALKDMKKESNGGKTDD